MNTPSNISSFIAFAVRAARLSVLLAPLALAGCTAGEGVLGDDCKSDSDCAQSLSCRAIADGTVLQCTKDCSSDTDCIGLPTPTIGASYTTTCSLPPGTTAGSCMAMQEPF